MCLARAEIIDAADASVSEPALGRLAAEPAAGMSVPIDDTLGNPPFDRTKYDRLRILTTELKRIVRDGGDVSIRRAGRGLPAPLLPGLLRLV